MMKIRILIFYDQHEILIVRFKIVCVHNLVYLSDTVDKSVESFFNESQYGNVQHDVHQKSTRGSMRVSSTKN